MVHVSQHVVVYRVLPQRKFRTIRQNTPGVNGFKLVYRIKSAILTPSNSLKQRIMKLISHEEFRLDGTDELPAVTFTNQGYLKIEGRIVRENVCDFARPLLKMISSYTGAKVIVDIKTDFLSRAGLHCVSQCMIALEANPFVKNILLNWYYDEQDGAYYEKVLFLEKA